MLLACEVALEEKEARCAKSQALSFGALEPADRATYLGFDLLTGHGAGLVLGSDSPVVGFRDQGHQPLALDALDLLPVHEIAERVQDGCGLELAGRSHACGEPGQASGSPQ